jgi:hypothetical protein
MVACEQQYAVGLVPVLLVFQPDIAAADRFEAFASRTLVELDEAKDIAQVRQRHGRLAELDSLADQFRDAPYAVHHGELRVNAQVNEGRGR